MQGKGKAGGVRDKGDAQGRPCWAKGDQVGWKGQLGPVSLCCPRAPCLKLEGEKENVSPGEAGWLLTAATAGQRPEQGEI